MQLELINIFEKHLIRHWFWWLKWFFSVLIKWKGYAGGHWLLFFSQEMDNQPHADKIISQGDKTQTKLPQPIACLCSRNYFWFLVEVKWKYYLFVSVLNSVISLENLQKIGTLFYISVSFPGLCYM